jgi:predicted nucleic acid-binding protein
MAKVFLDANVFMRLLEGKLQNYLDQLERHTLYISPLTVHIALYVHRAKVPFPSFAEGLQHFQITSLTPAITRQSLEGPTVDFEDNLQLCSAQSIQANNFITFDKQLLALKTLDQMKIINLTSNKL